VNEGLSDGFEPLGVERLDGRAMTAPAVLIDKQPTA
jgi:hypothetical protein